MKNFGTGLLTIALAVVPASAQEPWDTSFTLLAGTVSGAGNAYLGQSRSMGISVQGVYPITRKGFVLFEGGYRYLPTTTVEVALGQDISGFPGITKQTDETTKALTRRTLEYKSDGFFGSVCYRHIVWDEIYVQGGLRMSQLRNMLLERTGTYSLDHGKGPKTIFLAPTLAVGYRFNEKYGVEAGISALAIKNQSGEEKKATTLDLGLSIHFGK